VKTCVPGDSQRSQISGRNVDFYATFRTCTASIYGSAAGGGQRQSSTTNHATPMKGMGILGQTQAPTMNHAHPTKGIGILWFPFGAVSSFKCQASGWRRSGAEPSGLQSHTSPRKRLTASLRPGPKCAKRTQFRSAGAVNAQNEPNWAPQRARAGGKCAKRSQTWRDWGMRAKLILGRRSASHGETCKTKPNLGGVGYVGKDCCRVGCGSAGE
jgi:hypothetical protein